MHGIEVQSLRIVDAVQPGFPVLAAVDGADEHAVGADRVPALRVLEPHIEQRQRRAGTEIRFDRGLDVRQQFRVDDARLGIEVLEHLLFAAPVDLLFPGGARVGAVQNDAVVANHPALGVGRELYREQIALDRDLRLRPGLAFIVRGDDHPPQPDRDQALAGPGRSHQRALGHVRAHQCRRIERILKGSGNVGRRRGKARQGDEQPDPNIDRSPHVRHPLFMHLLRPAVGGDRGRPYERPLFAGLQHYRTLPAATWSAVRWISSPAAVA